MRSRLTQAVIDDIVELGDMVWNTIVDYGRELAELGEDPVRTRQGIVAACSVVLAVVTKSQNRCASRSSRRGGRRSAGSCR